MEDLMYMAFMLIYPDGTVERVPIGKHNLHIDYMKDHRKESPRFCQICRGLDFERSSRHAHIDEVLSLNGVIIVLNLSVYDIVEKKFDWESDIPYLYACLPNKLQSLEQAIAIEGVYETYPDNKLGSEVFDIKIDGYEVFNRTQVMEYIFKAKQSLSNNK